MTFSSYIRFCLLLLSLVILGACADPAVMAELSPKQLSAMQDCKNILRDIQNAENFKKEARNDDRFKPQYILLVPAVVSVYRMDKAERAAHIRLQQLQQLYVERNCHTKEITR